VSLAFVVVVSPIASQDSLNHLSLTLEMVGLLVGSSFVTLEGSKHSDCYSMRSWGIVRVRVWVVLERIIVLSHIVCLLLI
jgi:hypothetical protein